MMHGHAHGTRWRQLMLWPHLMRWNIPRLIQRFMVIWYLLHGRTGQCCTHIYQLLLHGVNYFYAALPKMKWNNIWDISLAYYDMCATIWIATLMWHILPLTLFNVWKCMSHCKTTLYHGKIFVPWMLHWHYCTLWQYVILRHNTTPYYWCCTVLGCLHVPLRHVPIGHVTTACGLSANIHAWAGGPVPHWRTRDERGGGLSTQLSLRHNGGSRRSIVQWCTYTYSFHTRYPIHHWSFDDVQFHK